MSEDDTDSQITQRADTMERLRTWLDQAVEKHNLRFYHAEGGAYRGLTRLVTFLAVVAMVAGAYLLLQVPYRLYQERRAVTLARAYLSHGNKKGTAIWAENALRLSPKDLVATKLMAWATAGAGSPEELLWQERVVELEPSIPNKFALADTALRCQKPPFPTTTHILDELAASGTTNPVWQMIAARAAMMSHDPAGADAHFVSATKLEPTNINYAVNFAIFRLSQTNEARRAEARAQLRQFSTDPVSGPMALRALIADRLADQDLAGATNFASRLVANPQFNLADQLQYLALLRQIKSADFTNRLAAMELGAQTSEEALSEASQWSLANNLAGENLAWLTNLPDHFQYQPSVRIARVETYEAAGRWQELSDFASQGNWGDLEYFRFATVSHASAMLNLPDVARFNWNSAVNESTGRLPAERRLLELAASWHLKPQSEELITRLVHDFPEEEDAVHTVTKIYLRNGDTRSMNRLFARLAPLYPSNSEYQCNLTATSLLLKTDLPAAEKRAAAAYAQTPENPRAVIAYAYALHLQRRDAEGIAVLKKLKPEDLQKPSPALYYGVLLDSAGKPAEAAPWLKIAKAAESSFLPEEREMLALTLAKK